jgi:phosphate starvation-inducible PhoH-like protein
MLTIVNALKMQKHNNIASQVLKNNQIIYKKALLNNNIPIVICTGAAGTGKTMIACYEAISKLQKEEIKKIIITRPTVTVEENLGFLPGTLEDKLYPFMIPIYDYFSEFYTKDQMFKLIKEGTIEIAPLAFMRGRTFTNSFVIADEMQNSSPSQFKMLLTRIGSNSKLVINGDLNQNDLVGASGLKDFLELVDRKYTNNDQLILDGFSIIELENDCIQRHKIIENILSIYDDL